MATGYEVAMYRHIEIMAAQSLAQTKALEAVAGGLAAIGEAIFEARTNAEERADALDGMADIIVDRFMPLCSCGQPGCADEAAKERIQRIVKATTDEADRLRKEGKA